MTRQDLRSAAPTATTFALRAALGLALCLALTPAAFAAGDHATPVVAEVDYHFDQAALAYQAGDMDQVASELEISGSYVRLEARRVHQRMNAAVDPEMRRELHQERQALRQTTEAIFDLARDFSWFGAPSVEELETLFADTDYALARYHHRRAAAALAAGLNGEASLHMRAVADHLEHGMLRSGAAANDVRPMAEKTRRLAADLRSDGSTDQSRTRAARAADAQLVATGSAIERLPH